MNSPSSQSPPQKSAICRASGCSKNWTAISISHRMGEAAYQKGAVKNTWQDYGDRLPSEYASRLNR